MASLSYDRVDRACELLAHRISPLQAPDTESPGFAEITDLPELP